MKIKNYLNTVILCMVISASIVACIANNNFYASQNFSSDLFISDEKGAIYHLISADNKTEVWKFLQNSKEQALISGDKFDNAFCSDHVIYFTENKINFIYAFQVSSTKYGPEFADVSLGSEYMMAATDDTWYFIDKAVPNTIIKCDYIKSQNEEIVLDTNIKEIFTDTETKKVFALTDKGLTDIDSNKFISCEIPVTPLKSNNNIYTDSSGDKYLFSSKNGFEKILDTEYNKICATKNDTYVLENNNIYSLDESGEIIAVYNSDMYISDIMASGNNLYAITEDDAVYIPKKYFTAYKNEVSKEESKKSDIIENQPSKTESKMEVSEKEQSQAIESTLEYIINSDVYEISKDIIYIPQGTKITQFKIGINYGDYSVYFTNHNGQNVTSGQMGTGWKVDFKGNGEVKSYYTIVMGDVTGEGNVNTKDMYLLRDYIFGKIEFSKYQCESADLKRNSIIDSVDMYLLVKELNKKGIL